jgi:hypothetical protein
MTGRYEIVLAIYPTRRGIAFVMFEGAHSPIDWGHVRREEPNAGGRCLNKARALFDRRPDVLVLQDTSWTGTRRSPRVEALNNAIFELAEEATFPVCTFSRDVVRIAFGHLTVPTRYAIAQDIAKNIPTFEHHLPPPRKRWLPEHERMGIFDAAALALTYFQHAASGEQKFS